MRIVCRDPFSQYSKTMNRLSLSRANPLYLTMLGWLRFLSKSISDMMSGKEDGARVRREMDLMATVSPVRKLRAL